MPATTVWVEGVANRVYPPALNEAVAVLLGLVSLAAVTVAVTL